MATTVYPTVRLPFEPDGASVHETAVQDAASPTQTSTALARFEFEAGRGNDGTKILMVEWEDDAHTRRTPGEWQVSWENKMSTVLSAKDRPRQDVHRLYFLLLPGVTIPPVVTLTHKPSSAATPTVWQIKSLPAIFPAELGATARSHGKKGVLHTLWAKKRLSELQREIESESRTNVEGVGLQMALQEREWIEQNFGIASRPTARLNMPPLMTSENDDHPSSPMSPTSPKTPGGGNRLAEKLKGLRVGTSERELSARPAPNTNGNISLPNATPPTGGQVESNNHLLSPDSSDVAISSFTAFHRPVTNSSRGMAQASPPPPPPPSSNQAQPSSITMMTPPPSQFSSSSSSSSSSNNNQAAPGPQTFGFRPPAPSRHHHHHRRQEEDDLFAVALSPRSPEMSKSPFSFSLAETAAAAAAGRI